MYCVNIRIFKSKTIPGLDNTWFMLELYLNCCRRTCLRWSWSKDISGSIWTSVPEWLGWKVPRGEWTTDPGTKSPSRGRAGKGDSRSTAMQPTSPLQVADSSLVFFEFAFSFDSTINSLITTIIAAHLVEMKMTNGKFSINYKSLDFVKLRFNTIQPMDSSL